MEKLQDKLQNDKTYDFNITTISPLIDLLSKIIKNLQYLIDQAQNLSDKDIIAELIFLIIS